MNNVKDMLSSVIPTTLLAGTSITVTATGKEIEQELIYPDTTPGKEVAASLAYELGVDFQPPIIKQIVETVDVSKTYWSGFEFSLNLEEGFKIKITRSPKKIIKNFTEK